MVSSVRVEQTHDLILEELGASPYFRGSKKGWSFLERKEEHALGPYYRMEYQNTHGDKVQICELRDYAQTVDLARRLQRRYIFNTNAGQYMRTEPIVMQINPENDGPTYIVYEAVEHTHNKLDTRFDEDEKRISEASKHVAEMILLQGSVTSAKKDTIREFLQRDKLALAYYNQFYYYYKGPISNEGEMKLWGITPKKTFAEDSKRYENPIALGPEFLSHQLHGLYSCIYPSWDPFVIARRLTDLGLMFNAKLQEQEAPDHLSWLNGIVRSYE